MSTWEYKVISSGKGGFASPALMEKFINDLGQEQWEIIHFHTAPDNPLAFSGLARRSTQRDWTLEDAAKAAARAEADKLRAEFEAKFRAGHGQGGPAEDDKAETFLAEEKGGIEGDFRRPVDTSRDAEPEAHEDDAAPKDDWDKLAEEDELPTFFDALRPHMRKNQRGPGMSVGIDFLAKKWKLDESDIKSALVECGLQIPADENARPVYVEFEGDLYWVNINRRGEVWINTREKPQPVFRVVAGTPVAEADAPADTSAPAREERPSRQAQAAPASAPRENGEPAAAAESRTTVAAAPEARTFLAKLRGLMRRNRRGHGWSGSFGFLTKALKTDDTGLLAQLAEHGVKLPGEGEAKPAFVADGDFVYWLQKNHRGEVWINARKERGPRTEAGDGDEGGDEDHASGEAPAAGETAPATTTPAAAESAPAPASAEPVPAPVAEAPAESAPTNATLAAVRLLLQPKKRGEGVTALVAEVARQLGKPAVELLEALVAAGLNVPDDAKTKPTFGVSGGEIFWLNRNSRDELWLNAKPAKSGGRGRGRKKDDAAGDAGDDADESAG